MNAVFSYSIEAKKKELKDKDIRTPELKRKKDDSFNPNPSHKRESEDDDSSSDEDVDGVTRFFILSFVPSFEYTSANEAELRKTIRDEVIGEFFFAKDTVDQALRSRIESNLQQLTRFKLESKRLSLQVDDPSGVTNPIRDLNQQILRTSAEILKDYKHRFDMEVWNMYLREQIEKADEEFETFLSKCHRFEIELESMLK